MSVDWARVRELFEQVVDLPALDATGRLDQAAGGDARLRAEVQSLLDNHRSAGAFLSEPPIVTASPEEATPLEPGQSLGPYTIVREVGHGGMGRVYMARDARLNRTVALKAVRSPADPAQATTLRSEAQAAARLAHQGVCTIFALEELEGELYIASEFVEGHTLRQEIDREGRPPVAAVLQIARELADALASAHEIGIAHGDLKPENVMRALSGRVKVLDFGLARVEFGTTRPDDVDERARGPAGTPGYMAPEQLRGGPRSARGDVFALGVMLYEYASGTHPFDGTTPIARASRVLEGEARPVQTLRADLPPFFATILERCMRPAAADRFASAVQIVEALSRAEQDVPRMKVATWWRTHHLIVIALYVAASIAAWRLRELQSERTTGVFLTVGMAATVAAVFRGHLLFTERMNRSRLAGELRRAAPVTMAMDILIALALAADAAMLAATASLPAVLAASLGIGLVLARLVVEPSTTQAAFEHRS